MNSPITTRAVSPLRLAAFITRAPALDLREAWGKLRPTATAAGLVVPESTFGAFFKVSSLTPTTFEWYAASLTLQPGQAVPATLEQLEFPGGSYATTTYRGGYEGLGNAWGSFVEELVASDRRFDLARLCFELYLDMPSTPSAEMRTELYVPVA